MKRRVKIIIISILAAIVALVVVFVAVRATSAYLDQEYVSLHEGCQPRQLDHLVVIKNDKANPENIIASRCETLTIKNLDNEDRMIAFGLHEDHVPYDGVSEKLVGLNGSLTVTLVQTGSFRFHDHIHDEVQATFQVK